MTVRNLAPTTQATYVQQVSMFARYFGRSPETLGAKDIRSYQVYLAMEKELAPSSISTAVAALRFLYNVTLQKHWLFEEVIPAPKCAAELCRVAFVSACQSDHSPWITAHKIS